MDTEGLIEMTEKEPNGPKQFKTEAYEEVECNAANPHHEEFQIDKIVCTEESENIYVLI